MFVNGSTRDGPLVESSRPSEVPHFGDRFGVKGECQLARD